MVVVVIFGVVVFVLCGNVDIDVLNVVVVGNDVVIFVVGGIFVVLMIVYIWIYIKLYNLWMFYVLLRFYYRNWDFIIL